MADLLADVFDEFEAFATDLSERVGLLAKYGADGHAHAVERVRVDLLAKIGTLREEYATLTVADFAKLHYTTASTVKRWIERGELEADRTATGWRIRRTAERTKPRGT